MNAIAGGAAASNGARARSRPARSAAPIRARSASSSTSAGGLLRFASPGSSTSRRSSNVSPIASLKPSKDCLRTAPISRRFVGAAAAAGAGCTGRPLDAMNASYSARALAASASRSATIRSARAYARAIFSSCLGESFTGLPIKRRITLRIARP